MPVLTFLSVLALLGNNAALALLLPSSYPHAYPGMPVGDYSPEWQSYFEVTDPLPNVTFTLSRSFAGNIAVQRQGHPNNTLFFWAFEHSNGSLTGPANTSNNDPWGIWLNGGPGASSLFGLTFENGPIHIGSDYFASPGNYSWDKLADYFWVDQPVGTGYSTADNEGYVTDEDQMGEDFWGFIGNVVKVFPSLQTRPLYITGESYAGTYIPYITKTYFRLTNPPTRLAKVAIGDGTICNTDTFLQLPVVSVIETFPQLIGYDPDVYEYFREQEHLCGYDLNLTYPQNGNFPTIQAPMPYGSSSSPYAQRHKGPFTKEALLAEAEARHSARPQTSLDKRQREAAFHKWKRDLTGRANGTIDPWYACDLFDEMIDYAVNFSFPWTQGNSVPQGSFDVYDVPDALFPDVPEDASLFLNDPRTRAAIHAPISKIWALEFPFPFGALGGNDPSPEPMTFLTELATNATTHSIPIVIYSGNNDALVPHRGSEVAIQNTTFGGTQGFSLKPSTPWFDDSGQFAGIVHQERNWTYVLFQNAGHMVPYFQPVAAFTFLREFVIGDNDTGLVTSPTSVVGGENSTLSSDYLPGDPHIFYGSGTTMSSYTYPPATISAWNSFIQTATAAPSGKRSSSSRVYASSVYWTLGIFSVLLSLM